MPDQQTVDALVAAAKRGVDVTVVLPGVSDSRIFHLKLAVLHAKTAVIDGAWSTVGSTNIDMRSFLHNSELNVIVLGDSFGREMENAFQEDLRDSEEITRAKWETRPLSDRMKEWAARFMNYWL